MAKFTVDTRRKKRVMTNVRLIPLKDEHLSYLWKILQTYENYFDDRVKMETLQDFHKWIKENVIEYLVGIQDEEIIGCGYLTDISNNNGEINIFVKRRSIKRNDFLDVINSGMRYFFIKYSLKMIYAITRVDNKACLNLMKLINMKPSDILKNHETVKGKKIDCIMYTILRRKILI